jgi:hypothetical protein
MPRPVKSISAPIAVEWMAERQRKLDEQFEQMKPKIDKDRFWND